MKTALLLLTCIVVMAADPLESPKLVGARIVATPPHHVILTWTHSTANKFQVRLQSPNQVAANYVFVEDPKEFRKSLVSTNQEFQDLVPLRDSRNVFSVRAIIGTNRTEWSNPIFVGTDQAPPRGGP